MTDQEIIKKLATEFMGWRLGNSVRGGEVWLTKRGEHPISIPLDDFDPLHYHAACALVLDEMERRGWGWKWDRWHGEHLELSYCFTLILPDREIWEYSDIRYRAVCLAALAACGVSVAP